MSSDPPVTELLARSRQGEQAARDRVFAILQDDLRRMAAALLRNGGFRRDAMMQTTMLVNSAVERLLERGRLDAENRRHLFSLLARSMHDVLVEDARARLARKRGAGKSPEALADVPVDHGAIECPTADELIALRAALDELATVDASAAEVVMLRFYCGRSLEETAEVIGVTPARVRGEWDYAKAWLADRLERP